VLLVTHDRYLIQALTSRVWAIVGRRLWLFGAGYEAYRTWVEQRRQKADLEEEGSVCRNCDEDRRVQKAAQRRAERRARQVTEIEEAIQRLEAQKVELEAELEAASAAQQVEQVAELGAEYSRLQAELDAKLALWEELA
jgi:ATP-binding cassette subfamily F protein 3